MAGFAAAAADDDWGYTATVYLWGAGIEGDTAADNHVDVGFDTLISNLDMAFMGSLEARRSRWSLFADVVYMDVSASDSGSVKLPVGPGIPARVDADVATKGTVLTLWAGYDLMSSETARVDLRAGVRYFNLALDFAAQLQPGPLEALAIERSIHDSLSVWDGILGLGGEVRLGERWYGLYHVDVGSGESRLTWQAQLGVGRAFDWGDVALSYRHLEWDFKSGSAIDNVHFSGPLLSARWHFLTARHVRGRRSSQHRRPDVSP